MKNFFTAEHLGALAAIIAAGTALCVAARGHPAPRIGWVSRALALTLVVNEASWWAVGLHQGWWSMRETLPLNLCDAAGFAAAAALWTRRPLLVELSYFWGLAGTLQALLTPELPQHFPDYFYFQYYIQHGGIVVAAFFLVAGLGLTPRAGAVMRVTGITLCLVALAAAADLVTGGDYMFLRSTPPGGSLLDLFGPWPWYILAATAVAIVFFLILDAPFLVMRRRQGRPAPSTV